MNGAANIRTNMELGHSLDHKLPRFFRNVALGFAYQRYGCQCHAGWSSLIIAFGQELLAYCDSSDRHPPAVLQIKEKAGSLRIVLATDDDAVLALASKYNQLSCLVCEICGASIDECHCTQP